MDKWCTCHLDFDVNHVALQHTWLFCKRWYAPLDGPQSSRQLRWCKRKRRIVSQSMFAQVRGRKSPNQLEIGNCLPDSKQQGPNKCMQYHAVYSLLKHGRRIEDCHQLACPWPRWLSNKTRPCICPWWPMMAHDSMWRKAGSGLCRNCWKHRHDQGLGLFPFISHLKHVGAAVQSASLEARPNEWLNKSSEGRTNTPGQLKWVHWPVELKFPQHVDSNAYCAHFKLN